MTDLLIAAMTKDNGLSATERAQVLCAALRNDYLQDKAQQLTAKDIHEIRKFLEQCFKQVRGLA